MQNYQQNGKRLRLFPDKNVKSGDIVSVGDLVGVAFANYDVADGDGVICDLEGVYLLRKAAGAFAQGQNLYVAGTGGEVTTTETGNIFIGHAADVATADAPEGSVRLKG